MFNFEFAIFLLASMISITLIYLQTPKNILFVFLSMILAFLVVLYSKFPLAYIQLKEHRKLLLIELFVSGLFIQLLLIATGGFLSAFIIILHLFTLGMSFIFNVKSAITFLLLSLFVLIATVLFDSQMQLLFQNDPWSFTLHGISFMVVIPLAHTVVSSYHLKDTLSKMLTEHLATKELQDESIFRGIGELVFISDKNLNIVFANEAAKKSLSLETAEIIGENILAVIPLQSVLGDSANRETLSIDQAITDKSAHMVKGFSILPKKGGRKMPVLIQIRPIYESSGELKQIIFVFTPDLGLGKTELADSQLLQSRMNNLQSELEQNLTSSGNPEARAEFTLLMAQIHDLLLFEQLNALGISEQKSLIDIAHFLPESMKRNTQYVKSLQTELFYLEGQENTVKIATQTKLNGFSLYSHRKNTLLTGVDSHWLEVLFDRLIHLFTLLSTSADKKVILCTGFNDSDQLILLVSTKVSPEIGNQFEQLELQNYGTLVNNINLKRGSGLEGIIAKKITNVTSMKYQLRFDPQSSVLQALITLPPNQ